ncbi:hypothetical protein [Rhodopirellula baltica]|uniref:hypothetical protein n=1 Tax=Rhodopirellula baltica TaxID=265606 RepID=UPI0003078219|nr:hypothetical protein [Rhodopirellula baltica]
MMDDPIRMKIAEHQRTRIADFESPRYDYFVRRFGCDVPLQLKRLYDLRSTLFCHGFSRDCGANARLWVQYFVTMTPSAIDYCEKYDFRYFHFAVGEDGESLLMSIEDPSQIFVDWDYEDVLPESFGLSFDSFVDCVVADPPERYFPES